MIQRIQTLYLFIAAILVFLMFFFPFAEIIDAKGQLYSFNFRGIVPIQDGEAAHELVVNSFPVMILIGLISLISFGSIFLFKKRMVQKRLGVFNVILSLGLFGLLFFYANYAIPEDIDKVHYSFPVIFPVIHIVLTIMANRAIQKDENLVRSVDRIR